MSIAGQIESGEFLDLDGLSVKYAFVAGDEWNIANGENEGQSPYCFKSIFNSSTGVSKKMAWNHPFDI